MTEHVQIAIVGAGLSGLALAGVLHAHGMPATVFELDSSPTARRQGGQLDIHEDTGQHALRAAGLHDAFSHLVHVGAQSSRVLNHNNVLLHESIDRGQLRKLFLDALPNGAVCWGKKLSQAQPLPNAQHRLLFDDGSLTTCALLVGGDGAWSRVRPLVSEAKPTYVGISFVECYLPDANARQPACAEAVGSGSLFALAPGQGILAHKENSGSLHIYVAMRAPESWLSSIDFKDLDAAKRALSAKFEGWAPELRALID